MIKQEVYKRINNLTLDDLLINDYGDVLKIKSIIHKGSSTIIETEYLKNKTNKENPKKIVIKNSSSKIHRVHRI